MFYVVLCFYDALYLRCEIWIESLTVASWNIFIAGSRKQEFAGSRKQRFAGNGNEGGD